MPDLLTALRSGRVLLMDGAMGTQLQRAGIAEDACYEQWNLTHPESVRAIHQAYAEAGAEVLLTNTFQANPASLARFGLDERLKRLARAALRLAWSVAGGDRFVVADIGPFDDDPETARPRWLPAVFLEADAILVETAADLRDLITVLKMILRRAENKLIPVLFSAAYQRSEDGELRTLGGDRPEECARRASRYPIAALGVNCGRDIGMDEIIEIVRRYRAVTDLPLFARPNAGTPKRRGKRWVYPHTPQKMAARLPELLEAGVCMVGGCCGTTPKHIAAFRRVVDEWNARGGSAAVSP
jgi:5-methyltetrahydrofolate--homocysteine methyltransferase